MTGPGTSGPIVEAVGEGPPDARAWLADGQLWICSRSVLRSLSLGERTAISPPRWSGEELSICSLGARGPGRLHRVALNGNDRPLDLPRETVDAIAVSSGYAFALANPVSGHVRSLALADIEARITATVRVPPAWLVAGESRGGSACWLLSRQGRRYSCEFDASGLACASPTWPPSSWQRRVFRSWEAPDVPAWVRSGRCDAPTWVVLHGGPFRAWDDGPPSWLIPLITPSVGVALLESPGAVGYGPRLVRWHFSSRSADEFSRVLRDVWRRVRGWCGDGPLYLAGESDGAALIARHLTSENSQPWDGIVLVNGEYPLRPARRPIGAPVLFAVSTDDDVVDPRSAERLASVLVGQGTPVTVLRLSDGHRWRDPRTSATLTRAVRRAILRRRLSDFATS